MITARQAFLIAENSSSMIDQTQDDFLDNIMDEIHDSASIGDFTTLIDLSKCENIPSFIETIEGLGYCIMCVSYMGKDDEKEKRMRIISWEDGNVLYPSERGR